MSKIFNYLYLFLFFSFFSFASISQGIPSGLVFHGTENTLDKIMEIISKKEKGAYFRFGDGDVNLALGLNDMLQTSNSKLSSEMKDAFSINNPNALKALPLHCKEFNSFEEGMFPGNHLGNIDWCMSILGKARQLWGNNVSDIYSAVALHFCATSHTKTCIKFLKYLKNNNCCLFVGNKNVSRSMIDLLFGPSCAIVPTPTQNSYFEIDRIEKECLQKVKNDGKYKIIIVAMGCSGRALEKRLWNKLDNVFLFDFGSLLDALCGWDTRAWIGLSGFDANNFIKQLKSDIKVVYTAALIDQNFDQRKCEYIKSIKKLDEFGYVPYIVENCKIGQTFLDEYSQNVCYSNSNDMRLKNKGVNEARSLIQGFKHFNFNDEDMIIKLTGRYCLADRLFIDTVENNPDTDAFVKCDSYGQVFTGCFALRYKYFKDMLSRLDFVKMEANMINIERLAADYIKNLALSGRKILYLNKLNVSANIYGQGENYNINNVVYW